MPCAAPRAARRSDFAAIFLDLLLFIILASTMTTTNMKVPTDLAGLAKLILSPECKSIVVLTGAGVSVASGIPDFRSPGGLYSTLRPELITATERQRASMTMEPTKVVSWDMFQQNAFPYLEVRRPFILGTQQKTWKATIAHRFFELLHTKMNKLTRYYTQNIDGLDRQCDKIPSDKVVHVHGSISKVSCEGCGEKEDFHVFCDSVRKNIKDIYGVDPDAPKESTNILCKSCGKPLVKPSTVMFGRSLPREFFEKAQVDLPTADLLIVAGTSLVVSPANSLVYNVPESTIRVVVNQEQVGMELGIEYDSPERDFFAQGPCDQVFLDLIEQLGWLDDLKQNIDKLPEQSAEMVRQKSSLKN